MRSYLSCFETDDTVVRAVDSSCNRGEEVVRSEWLGLDCIAGQSVLICEGRRKGRE
jgi:hypothetical protein